MSETKHCQWCGAAYTRDETISGIISGRWYDLCDNCLHFAESNKKEKENDKTS